VAMCILIGVLIGTTFQNKAVTDRYNDLVERYNNCTSNFALLEQKTPITTPYQPSFNWSKYLPQNESS